jgi:PrtD family type I secretion system ABC transporter
MQFTATVGGISKFVRTAVQILIMAAGAYLITKGELTSGGMIAGSIILGRALQPAEQALGAWRSFTNARQAHHRLMALLEAAPADAHKIELPEPKGLISIEGASFQIPGQDRPILRGVNLTIEPGTIVALMGTSASGKSTLCKLLIGALQPTTGAVRLDGASLKSWNEAQLGRTLGYLPQSVDLFTGTVRENIARLSDPVDADVIAAAERAGCHDLIVRLPTSYETEVGEGGAALSGGQRQRIALARALYGNPKVVILDEPNANLDNEGEAALHKAIRDLKASGTTIILVSHRMAALAVVDKVAVLKDGVIERYEDRNVILKDLLTPVSNQAQPKTDVPKPATATPQTATAQSVDTKSSSTANSAPAAKLQRTV